MSEQERQLQVSAEQSGKRVDLFVGEALSLPRARLKRLFEEDAVRVDGRKASKGLKVQAGQTITVKWKAESRAAVADDAVPLDVLHEDAALVFVDKKAGQPSHPLQPGETGTLANALIARYPECAAASLDEREGGICHRLDVETSGVLLAARDRATWEAVREAFNQRAVDKRYWALVTGPLADEGEIDVRLRHHPRHPDRVEPALFSSLEGREAHSFFTVLSRSGDYSLVEVKILTGVLHQVRAHMASVGAPIVGDALYGGEAEPGLGRFFLHARSLALSHPTSGERIQVKSPLPPELQTVLEKHGLTPPEN